MSYAIVVDIDIDVLNVEMLKANDTRSLSAALRAFEQCMNQYGFKKRCGVYFGDSSVNAVTCCLLADRLTSLFPVKAVSEMRMLRVTDNDDLWPVFNHVLKSVTGGQSVAGGG